jgi:hypothetical protein
MAPSYRLIMDGVLYRKERKGELKKVQWLYKQEKQRTRFEIKYEITNLSAGSNRDLEENKYHILAP